MIDMIGNEVSGTIAIEKNTVAVVFNKLELSPVVPESPIREVALFPPISREALERKDKKDEESISGRKQKGCRCKQSKCLKLYCDCYSSGLFCSDCDCADCHNNPEKCEVREAALVNVIDRNPTAFHGKPLSCPINTQYKAKLGLLPRGCKCKRTKCLKKYCECFQANVMCSHKCKCINCENVNEEIQPSAFAWGRNKRKLFESYENNKNANALGLIYTNTGFNSHNAAGCMNYAPGFSAHSSLQVYRRRRCRELPEQWNSCPAPLSFNSIFNPLGSPVSSSPKLPFRKKRSRLGYTTTHLPDLGDICSLLLAASESATANAGNTPMFEVQPGVQAHNMICIKTEDKLENMCLELSGESENRNVDEEIPSCGRLIQLIDAQYNGEEEETKTNGNETDIYMEHERAVLENFRDCLHKFINIWIHKRSGSFNKKRAKTIITLEAQTGQ